MWSRSFRVVKHFLIAVVLGTWAFSAALSQQSAGKVDFRRDVHPILKQFCVDCHGPSQQMNGLRLDRRRDAMKGGTLPVLIPGSSATSRLYLKVIGSQFGPQMPPTGALRQEQQDILQAWIDQGAEWPDDLSGETPPPLPELNASAILTALRDGDKQVFKKLALENPKTGDLRGPRGVTPLMQAVLYGDVESVRVLLERGANPNLRNEAGATALMWAVTELEKTRLLLDRGADVNARSDDSRTPLLIAAGHFGNIEVVKLLLNRGADVNVKSPGLGGNMTPLSEAARVRDEALLRLLIERGADVRAAGVQPLAFAIYAQCENCADVLIERSDPRTLSIAALISAPPFGDGRAVKRLVDRGADVNAKDPGGHSLLMLTASADTLPVETVKYLVERGADINVRGPEGRSAFDFAKLRGSTPVVDLLSKAGAKETPAATTPLFSPKQARSIREAVGRSIPLLQKSDSIFLQKSGCVSCHNNTLTAMTIATARKNKLPVDDQVASNTVKKIGAFIESWRERALQGVGIPGDSDTVSYILVGLAAENYPSDAATDALARFVKGQQWPDGGWRIFAHRPPIESNDIQVTATSMKSLQVYGPRARRAEYETAVKRAADWLMKAQPLTTEERAFQLLGLGWAGVNAKHEIMRKAARDLVAQQRPDGGWAQIPSLASDAYATGQALVALREAGAMPSTDPAYKRGIEFLLKTQFEDGSWYVKSRAIPFQPFFESGFPFGHDQWVSAAASNWATMALVLGGGR